MLWKVFRKSSELRGSTMNDNEKAKPILFQYDFYLLKDIYFAALWRKEIHAEKQNKISFQKQPACIIL